MNVIVVIEGREAIPVRAIPLLTNFETISVDYVAHVLAWDEEYHGFDGLQAFHLDNPQRPISATWWENIACRELKALSDSIRAVEVTHETGLQDWRRKSLRVLPSGVFVWKDAFEPMHLCRYGRDGTTFLSTTALNGVIPEDEQERRVALDFDPFIPDLEIRHLVMEGFKPQATTPSPAPVPQAAPVVAASAPGAVDTDQAGPAPMEQGLPTKDIAHVFDGVNGWSIDRWSRNLSASKWLHPARISIGRAGGTPSVWSPVMLAQLMHDNAKGKREKEKLMKTFNSRFTLNLALRPWRDAFNEYFATHCAID